VVSLEIATDFAGECPNGWPTGAHAWSHQKWSDPLPSRRKSCLRGNRVSYFGSPQLTGHRRWRVLLESTTGPPWSGLWVSLLLRFALPLRQHLSLSDSLSLSRSLPLVSLNLTVSHSLARSLCISWLEESKGRARKREKGEERRVGGSVRFPEGWGCVL
jgi:hypothetical protein